MLKNSSPFVCLTAGIETTISLSSFWTVELINESSATKKQCQTWDIIVYVLFGLNEIRNTFDISSPLLTGII